MDSFSKIVIAINFNESNLETLKNIHRMDFLATSEIHFVHVVEELTYSTELGVTLVMQDDERKRNIREALVSKMKAISKEILPYSHQGKVVFEVLFSSNHKFDFCNYLEQMHADLVIVAPRKHRGIFSGSFTYYVGKNSTANMLVLKEPEEGHSQIKLKGKMKILVGVKLIQDLDNKKLTKILSFIKHAEIKMVHIFPVVQSGFWSALDIPSFPEADSRLAIEESVKRNIEARREHFLPAGFDGALSVDCVFSTHPRRDFCEMTRNMDIVILFAKGSFFHHQLTNSFGALLLLRNNQQ